MSDMNFSSALAELKDGLKIAREDWKNTFLYYVPANSYPASRNTLNTMAGIFPDDLVPYGAYIAMKIASNKVVPWSPSVTDILADDWCVV